MDIETLDSIKDSYRPLIKTIDPSFAGILAHPSKGGEEAQIMTKGFLTSDSEKYHSWMVNLLSVFISTHEIAELNNLLVVVHDNEAKIYKNFPLILNVKVKREIQPFTAVYQKDLIDIAGVQFKDDFFDLDIKDGDRFLWLHRNGWLFGLFFDFTKSLKVERLSVELGDCYRRLAYYSLYAATKNLDTFRGLLEKGWFPFLQLVGTNEYERLAHCDGIEEHLNAVESGILKKFDKARLQELSSHWWSNDIFVQKRKLIEAGLDAFLSGSEGGYINAIKNLTTEIEGIIRLDFYRTHKRSPSMKELKEHLLKLGSEGFDSEGSLAFPDLFKDYLDSVLFRNFDLEKEDVGLSRHSVGHGVARSIDYSETRALQMILTLDQIFFYLNRKPQG